MAGRLTASSESTASRDQGYRSVSDFIRPAALAHAR